MIFPLRSQTFKSWISGREAEGQFTGGTDEEILTHCTSDMVTAEKLRNIMDAEEHNELVEFRAARYIASGRHSVAEVDAWKTSNRRKVPSPCFHKTKTYLSMLVEACAPI